MCCNAQPQDLLTRIREHLREYVTQLPDYTCRVTIERSQRRTSRVPFELTDRLRLEVVFSGGEELYAWPGSERFERSIMELSPAHGMVSDGSYALHLRTIFVRNAATFDTPHESNGRIELAFHVPAVRSGYAMSTPEGSAPAALSGTLWLDASQLDLQKMEVRVETRVGRSVETTTYAREHIGDADFVAPHTTELIMMPSDGVQALNYSEFRDYHRFAGSSTVNYGNDESTRSPAAPKKQTPSNTPPPRRDFTASLDQAIGEDAAIGDAFTLTMDGAKYTGRITDMRHIGRNQWNLELRVADRVTRKVVRLPIPAGTGLRFTAR